MRETFLGEVAIGKVNKLD